jgi:succinyl-CoA synthetase beta subunit
MDAKLGFDDNAEFRQQDIFALRDISQEEPSEVEAQAAGLNFIKLDGSIGCLVNGAGLAMATMDVLTLHGGQPANFLDVGGGATPETVKKAFQILLRDPKVKSIFINIFGGIMRCDYIAEGVIKAASELELTVPLVVRLKGTKEAEAKECVTCHSCLGARLTRALQAHPQVGAQDHGAGQPRRRRRARGKVG